MGDITYQPVVVKKANQIIEALKVIGFFEENEITDQTFAKNELCQILTTNFIEGSFDEKELSLTDKEIDFYLSKVIAENTLRSLVNKGLLGTYEDDGSEEVFFLTELGKAVKDEIIYDDLSPSGSLN